MAVIFLLERVYGLARARFVPGRIPWSGDVVNALRRLASLGLVEELHGRAYRLTEDGRMAVERYSMGDPRIRYPFADIRFFIEWDTNTLAEYIKVNYPEWVA
jgi:DNA-binding PadR family transcriptional regulator